MYSASCSPLIEELYRGVSVIVEGNQSTWRKTTNLSQVIDKPYHIKLFALHLTISEIRTHNYFLVMIDTDCTGSCKYNYQAIPTTAAAIVCIKSKNSIYYMAN